ncbi:hypothetical protein LEN26_019354 [Aphanomyces euteiches]|nr:hypothetical protein LEN26_019354 [Aphanomyces euteiches]KAH9113283.1 hypothetical protein AeMF1_012487 [Aphanomyces euteiches]KAH9187923.1 hypothetical protein AeNC1_010106 [Aphanomyces euteiches]
MSQLSLPLPPNFFRCPPLTEHERQRFLNMGFQSARELVAKAKLERGPYRWSRLSNESDMKIYKGYGVRAVGKAEIHCAVKEAVGDLNEVIQLYRSDTTEEAKEHMRRFGRAYVDAVKLYTILPRDPAHPNDCMHIKWYCTKSPLDGIVTRRDFCLLETDLEIKIDGRRGWVRAFKSVELPCVPHLRDLLNCIRAYQYDMGHVFYESQRSGYLHMTYLADMDVRGNVPAIVNDESVKAWCRNLSDIDRFMREDRLSRTPFLRKDQFCPLNLRLSCYFCQKSFGPLRRKSNCNKCGEVVCKKCNPLWLVRINGEHEEKRACYACSLNRTALGTYQRSWKLGSDSASKSVVSNSHGASGSEEWEDESSAVNTGHRDMNTTWELRLSDTKAKTSDESGDRWSVHLNGEDVPIEWAKAD